jgi:hypothetical protein
VHSPYYALFIVGPAANLVEIAIDRRRQTASATVPGRSVVRSVSPTDSH